MMTGSSLFFWPIARIQTIGWIEREREREREKGRENRQRTKGRVRRRERKREVKSERSISKKNYNKTRMVDRKGAKWESGWIESFIIR